MDLVSWRAKPSIVQDRGVLGRAGEAIGRLGGRREVGRGASSESVMLARGMDLVSWGAEPSIVRGRGVWRREVVTRRTTPPAGGRAGAAIGRLGGRRDVGRGASSESVMLARLVSNEFLYLLPLRNI